MYVPIRYYTDYSAIMVETYWDRFEGTDTELPWLYLGGETTSNKCFQDGIA